MGEKVIHEVRFVETDDGFRIEVKGDKDVLRYMGGPCMGYGPGMGMGFGRGPRSGRHFRRHARRWSGYAPWWWGDEETEEGEPGGEPGV
jgi:hypothetical protein